MREYAPILISAVALVFAWYQYLRTAHSDDTTQITTVIVKLEAIAEGITEIKSDMRNIKEELQDLRERVAKVEASTTLAHKRIDRATNERDQHE